VRLRYAYFVKCVGISKDEKTGRIKEIHCTYDPQTRGGDSPDGRKVKSTLHWVSCRHAITAEVRLYQTLFTKRDPNDVAEGEDFTANLNLKSLEVLSSCRLEASLKDAAPGKSYQFERLGYFWVDSIDASGKPIFNRIVTLRDTWAKIESRL
jgi:glutaminyl-tRNA synthetase